MELGITILAIVLVSRGVLQTFMQDLWWRVVYFRYVSVGLTPTRTAAWARWSTIAGCFWLFAGVIVYVFVPR
jgi:hypothetical protein